jgi:hypothetical protein
VIQQSDFIYDAKNVNKMLYSQDFNKIPYLIHDDFSKSDYMNIAKIDYDLINHGLITSKHLTDKLNILNNYNPPCKCSAQVKF